MKTVRVSACCHHCAKKDLKRGCNLSLPPPLPFFFLVFPFGKIVWVVLYLSVCQQPLNVLKWEGLTYTSVFNTFLPDTQPVPSRNLTQH